MKILLLILLWLPMDLLAQGFKDNACLDARYQVAIERHFVHPLIKTKSLTIDKDQCEISLQWIRYFILRDEWLIDVCRGPIHIKKSRSSADFFRKDDCSKTSASGEATSAVSDYCRERGELEQVFQNFALIFAEGAKEYLDAPHGQIYCAYQLINHYLDEGIIFNRHQKYDGVLMTPTDERIPPGKEHLTPASGDSKGEMVPGKPQVREL